MTKIKQRKNKTRPNENPLTYLAEVKQSPIQITIIDYDEAHYQEKIAEQVQECFLYAERATVTWINIDGVHDPQLIKNLGMFFRLHPLLQEDIMSANHRPKVDFYENNVFLVTKMLSYNHILKQVETEQVSFVLGESYLLSFQEDKEGDVFDVVRQQLRTKPKGKLRNMGESYLFYVLLDTIVSGYVDVMERISDELDILEERIMNEEYIREPTKQLYALKRQLTSVRKAVRPLLDASSQLLKEEGKFLDSTNFYMRDLRERINQVSENIEIAIDTSGSLLDLHLNILGNKTNQVMKVLTIMSAIFLPLSFIAGVYGMNFDVMPELKMKMGYYYTLYGMAGIVISLLVWFKIKRWV